MILRLLVVSPVLSSPIGSSGVQYFANMAHYLVNENKKYGLQTLCGGGGVGIATVVERVK